MKCIRCGAGAFSAAEGESTAQVRNRVALAREAAASGGAQMDSVPTPKSAGRCEPRWIAGCSASVASTAPYGFAWIAVGKVLTILVRGGFVLCREMLDSSVPVDA